MKEIGIYNIIFPFAYFYLCYVIMRHYDKDSRDKLEYKRKDWIISFIELLAIIFVLIERKDIPFIETHLLIFLLGYLMFQSYTDYKMREVYCIFNYLAIAIGLSFSLIYMLNCSFDMIVLMPKFIGMVGIIVFLLIAKFAKLYGGGDGEVILACALLLFSTDHLISTNGLFVGIIIGLFISLVYKLIVMAIKKADKTVAMVPSIAIGIYLATLIGV